VPAARDEVQNYLDGQYVSASEACHWLFAFDLHDMHPNVYPLAVHLPNEQTSYFPEGTTVGEAMMRNNSVATPLWPSVGVKPNTWKSWRLGVFRDSRMFRARQQGAKHLALGCSWYHWKGLET
jgi:hypothetical protein